MKEGVRETSNELGRAEYKIHGKTVETIKIWKGG